MPESYTQTDTHATAIRAQIRTATSAPSAIDTGEIYYDTRMDALFLYTGNNWLGFKFTAA